MLLSNFEDGWGCAFLALTNMNRISSAETWEAESNAIPGADISR